MSLYLSLLFLESGVHKSLVHGLHSRPDPVSNDCRHPTGWSTDKQYSVLCRIRNWRDSERLEEGLGRLCSMYYLRICRWTQSQLNGGRVFILLSIIVCLNKLFASLHLQEDCARSTWVSRFYSDLIQPALAISRVDRGLSITSYRNSIKNLSCCRHIKSTCPFRWRLLPSSC